MDREIGKLNDKLKEEKKRNLAFENEIAHLLEQKKTDTENKNELRERVNQLEQNLAQTRGGFYNGEVIGNDSDNHKDCSDEEENRNNKQHATTIKEITNIVVHTEDDKSVETEGIGSPQSRGEMMSS